MKTITLKSGFEFSAKLFQWETPGFRMVARSFDNTWKGDGDTTTVREIPDGFKGAVTRSNRHSTQVELLGFSESELNAPAAGGWALIDGQNTSDARRVNVFGDLAMATLGGRFLPDVEALDGGKAHAVTGELLVELPFYWGDQAASSFAVYSAAGEFIRQETGCGDSSPEPRESHSGWSFTSAAERREEAIHAEDARFDAARDRGNNHPDATHVRGCYKRGMNPLPTLRKSGGQWKWFKAIPDGDTADDALIITEHVTPTDAGWGWAVIGSK